MENDASLVLASAAFGVALLSLYLGNLKRADIQMIVLADRPIALGTRTRREVGPPERGEVLIPVAFINSGARPGLLTDVDVERKQESFVSIEGCRPDPNFRDSLLGAVPLLAGESRAFVIEVTARFPDEAVEAWQNGTFKSFEVVLAYAYLRGRKIRPRSTRRLAVQVPTDDISEKPASG